MFDEGKKYDFGGDSQGFVALRQKSPGNGRSESEFSSTKTMGRVLSKKLFSQHKPELHFYRPPALNKGVIRKNTGLQKSHVPYMEPLMKFFHDSIDFERVMEINK